MKKKIQEKGKNTRTKKVKVQATGENLTSNGGLVAVGKFMEHNNFSSKIKKTVPVVRAENAVYQFSDIIEHCVVGIIGGARSLAAIQDIWKDIPLQKMLGWNSVPHRTVIARLFESLSMEEVIGMENFTHKMREKIWNEHFLPNRNSDEPIIIDVDSTVKTTYGNQEGAEKGFNSSKKGAKSFNPQLAFCAETKEILQGWYRCGSAYTANGIVEFMEQFASQLPTTEEFFIRADSGYFSEKLLAFLELMGYGYLIKVKLKNLNALLEKQDWKEIKNRPGWEETTFSYKCQSWDTARTFKAVREEIKEENPENLLLEVKRYSYFCYVTTDKDLTPWEVHKKYGKRATCETWIEEGKNQVAIGNIKSQSFVTSSILFQCTIIAYNTFRYMGLVSGNKKLQQWEPETIRTYLIKTAGKLLTGSRQLKMITPITHYYSQEWEAWLRTGGLQKTG